MARVCEWKLTYRARYSRTWRSDLAGALKALYAPHEDFGMLADERQQQRHQRDMVRPRS
jgi:hypothetical protein